MNWEDLLRFDNEILFGCNGQILEYTCELYTRREGKCNIRTNSATELDNEFNRLRYRYAWVP